MLDKIKTTGTKIFESGTATTDIVIDNGILSILDLEDIPWHLIRRAGVSKTIADAGAAGVFDLVLQGAWGTAYNNGDIQKIVVSGPPLTGEEENYVKTYTLTVPNSVSSNGLLIDEWVTLINNDPGSRLTASNVGNTTLRLTADDTGVTYSFALNDAWDATDAFAATTPAAVAVGQGADIEGAISGQSYTQYIIEYWTGKMNTPFNHAGLAWNRAIVYINEGTATAHVTQFDQIWAADGTVGTSETVRYLRIAT